MQHIDCVGRSREINHAKRTRCIPHTDFSDALSDRRHRLPVVRIEPALYSFELEPGIVSRPIRKGVEISERTANEDDRLHPSCLYQFRYNKSRTFVEKQIPTIDKSS